MKICQATTKYFHANKHPLDLAIICGDNLLFSACVFFGLLCFSGFAGVVLASFILHTPMLASTSLLLGFSLGLVGFLAKLPECCARLVVVNSRCKITLQEFLPQVLKYLALLVIYPLYLVLLRLPAKLFLGEKTPQSLKTVISYYDQQIGSFIATTLKRIAVLLIYPLLLLICLPKILLHGGKSVQGDASRTNAIFTEGTTCPKQMESSPARVDVSCKTASLQSTCVEVSDNLPLMLLVSLLGLSNALLEPMEKSIKSKSATPTVTEKYKKVPVQPSFVKGGSTLFFKPSPPPLFNFAPSPQHASLRCSV